jgi:hypothetical protein
MASQSQQTTPTLDYPAPEPFTVGVFATRGWLVTIFLTVMLVSVFLPLGEQIASVVFFRLFTDGAVVLGWMLAVYGIGWGAVCVTRLVRAEDASLGTASTFAAGLGLISIGMLLLGLAGVLNTMLCWSVVGFGCLMGIVAALRSNISHWWSEPAGWEWLLILLAPIAGVAIDSAFMPPGVLWGAADPSGYDVVEYHLQVPREWFEANRIIPLHHNVFSFMPFNVEMHYLMGMYLRSDPWRGMYVAQLMHVTIIAALVAAVYSIVKRHNHLAAVIAALGVGCCPWILMLAPVAYDEGGMLLFGTLAVGWWLRSLEAGATPRAIAKRAMFAGAFAGFACGSKLTAVPVVMIGIPLATFMAHTIAKRQWGAWIKQTAIFGFAGLVTFSPWLVRNMAWANNPVFPEAMSLLGKAHFNDIQVERWKEAHAPRPDQQSIGGRLKAGWEQIGSDFHYGYALIPIGLLATLLAWKQQNARLLLALLGVQIIFWLFFTHLQGRFFVLAIPLAALGIAQLQQRWMIGLAASIAVLGSAFAWTQAGYAGNSDSGGILHRYAEFLGWSRTNFTLGRYSLAGGFTQFEWYNHPETTHFLLVGDARAFWYQRRMNSFTYRTVFDTTGEMTDPITGWLQQPRSFYQDQPYTYIIIDNDELRRMSRTYYSVAPPPADEAGLRSVGP